MAQKTICVDFDGTIVDYSEGYRGRGIFGEILPGVAVIFTLLKEDGFKIIIFTTRSETGLIADYLTSKGVPFDEINTNSDQPPGSNKGKPAADMYIDDRAITFRGNWEETYKQIHSFKPWYEE